LRKFNDQLPEALSRLADTMREEDRYMHEETKALMERYVRIREKFVTDARKPADGGAPAEGEIGHHHNKGGAECSFLRSDFVRFAVALQRRLIKLILNYLHLPEEFLDFSKLENIRQSIVEPAPTTAHLDLHKRFFFAREYDVIRFVRRGIAAAGDREDETGIRYAYTIEDGVTDGTIHVPEAHATFSFSLHELEEGESAEHGLTRLGGGSPMQHEAWFDFDRLQFPLQIRSRIDGDRIEPVGLTGSKKVKNMFIDAKVPRRFRNRLPLLVDGVGRILWIPCFRRSRHAQITADTTRIWQIRMTADVEE